MTTAYSLVVAFVLGAGTQSDNSAADVRAELPRDIRVILLGVPSVTNVRASAENLARAVADLDAELAGDTPASHRIDAARGRIFFRLGQMDEAMAGLKQALRDQERIKGLESYRDFARSLELHSETLAVVSGTSEAPAVSEDDSPVPTAAPATPRELVRLLKSELEQIDELLTKIDQQAKPDADRKAQLERDMGALGQFVFQMRNMAEDIKADAGQGTRRVDTGEIVRGVQGLIDAIRDMKREKELKQSQPRREPELRSRRIDRPRP
jgi:hypothetical protein